MNKNLLPTAAVLALVAGGAEVRAASITTLVSTQLLTAEPSLPSPTNAAGGVASGSGSTNVAGVNVYSFVAPQTGNGSMFIQDVGLVGDAYTLFFGTDPNALSNIGTTPLEPVSLVSTVGNPYAPPYSSGTIPLGSLTQGVTYYYTFGDVTLQYIGKLWPSGIYHPTGPTTAPGPGSTTYTADLPATFSPSPNYSPFTISAYETYTPAVSPTPPAPGVPEPGTLSLLGSGLISAGLLRRRRARRK